VGKRRYGGHGTSLRTASKSSLPIRAGCFPSFRLFVVHILQQPMDHIGRRRREDRPDEAGGQPARSGLRGLTRGIVAGVKGTLSPEKQDKRRDPQNCGDHGEYIPKASFLHQTLLSVPEGLFVFYFYFISHTGRILKKKTAITRFAGVGLSMMCYTIQE
jgi:hypothetical protein